MNIRKNLYSICKKNCKRHCYIQSVANPQTGSKKIHSYHVFDKENYLLIMCNCNISDIVYDNLYLIRIMYNCVNKHSDPFSKRHVNKQNMQHTKNQLIIKNWVTNLSSYSCTCAQLNKQKCFNFSWIQWQTDNFAVLQNCP